MAKHTDTSHVAASARRARARNMRLIKACIVVIVVSVAFVAGFTARGDASLLESLGFTSLVVDVDRNPGSTTSGDTYDSLGARVEEVEGIIDNDSLDSYDLNMATTNVLNALSDTTEDAYLRYYDPARYAALMQDSAEQSAGIGVLFSEYKGRAYAADVFEGSAAQMADVRSGDFVVAIDGDRGHEWTTNEVTSALKREEGENVVITWRRASSLDDEGGEEFTTTLVCSNYAVKNVETELSDTVGYIKLKQITQNAADLVKNAVADLESQGATSFVLDIRDNPGGFLTQSVDIASLFVKSGTIVKIQTKAEETSKTTSRPYVTEKPLVLLVNGKTSASAEVLAASLKDNQRATLVGSTTLGKGSVQVTRDLSFGGALRYTAAFYKSPLGHDIEGVGVTPDVMVGLAEGEFFVPESKMAGAFDGDLVEVAPLPVQSGRKKQPHERKADLRAGEKPAARVLRVVDRAHDTLVGRYEVAEPFGVVVPEDANIPYDIFTMRADRPDIEDGSLVRVRITTFPSRNTAATGVIEEVLGLADDEHAAVDVVIARHKLETVFSEGALSEARSAVLDEDGALASGYRDLRERFTFTIDPADARDFDDAVSLEPVSTCGVGTGIRVVDERGLGVARWRLGVHIADVAHYVPWNSSLDLDARRRATSVYLVDRVIPMLPDELSGDLCSLKPDEVRRTMTADLYLDDRARLVAYDLYPALIRSHARLSYEEAQALLDRCHPERSAEGAESKDLVRRDGACAPGDGLSDRLAALSRLAKQRFASRERAGGLDFDSVEARVVLDEEGSPTGIDLRVKTDATSLIEEAMILANETVAKHLRDAKFPSLYRVHEQPSADSLAALVPVFQDFAWFRDIDQADFIAGDAHVVQRVLEASAERPEGELVSTLLLRSMKRAVYRPDCAAHYGLASGAYTHFTSPIRRYPDLVVHRMLKALIGGRPEKFDQEKSALPWIAEHSSDMERIAEKAARESQEVKLIEYLERFVGQTFSATVSGVATYGAYVRLDNTAEGLIPCKNLGSEYFALDPVQHRLTGQDTGASYRLAQRLAVVLVSADPRARRLDFRPARDER